MPINPLIEPDTVTTPFTHDGLLRLACEEHPIVLTMNPSKLSDRHQVLMLAVGHGKLALPSLWRVEAREGAIGVSVQKELLDAAPLVPEGAELGLMAITNVQ
jgi:hypothetical protein